MRDRGTERLKTVAELKEKISAPIAEYWWSAAKDGLLGLIYPRVCVGCDDALDKRGEKWLCEICAASLVKIEPPYCEICGQPYEGKMLQGFRCSNCSDLRLNFDFAVSGYRAEGLARELIHRFKYERQHFLCGLLGRLLKEALSDERLRSTEMEDWLAVPVPLHPRREREREFNQAYELCRVFRRVSPGLHVVKALRRTRYTRRQANLDRSDRLKNLKDAFSMLRSPKGRETVEDRNVLLVDDVLTTGATASECARVLREEGGAAKVVVITVVRG